MGLSAEPFEKYTNVLRDAWGAEALVLVLPDVRATTVTLTAACTVLRTGKGPASHSFKLRRIPDSDARPYINQVIFGEAGMIAAARLCVKQEQELRQLKELSHEHASSTNPPFNFGAATNQQSDSLKPAYSGFVAPHHSSKKVLRMGCKYLISL